MEFRDGAETSAGASRHARVYKCAEEAARNCRLASLKTVTVLRVSTRYIYRNLDQDAAWGAALGALC